MNFRAPQPADAPILALMNRQLIEDEGHRNPMSLAELEHRMRQWLLTGEYQAVVIEESSGTPAPLGYMLFCRRPEHVYLRQLFVDRTARRRGIGTAAVAWLRKNICRDAPLRIEVLVHNGAALAFYRYLGFHDYAITMEFESPPTVRPNPGAPA